MVRNIDDPKALLNAAYRVSFPTFLKKAWAWIEGGEDIKWNWHLDAMAHRLDLVAKGKVNRLMINMPPRNGKSNISSAIWIAWMLGQNPKFNFVCVSYSNELSLKLARICISILTAPWYAEIFPDTVISKRRSAAHDFETTAGGGRLSTSITGTLTGRGGDIIVLDDVIKPDEAASETQRNNVNNWYRSTLSSRLNNKATGAIICVMQRLHQYDLAGMLLEDAQWDHLSLPAIAVKDELIPLTRGRVHVRKTGDVLHPEREDMVELQKQMALMGSYLFAAQYQQEPVPELGNIFHKDWFQLFDANIASTLGGSVVQSWDTGIKTTAGHDWSVCITARIWDQRIYVIDVWRGRLEYPDLERKCIELARAHNAQTILIEDRASGQQLIQSLRGRRPEGVPLPVAMNPTQDKVTRATGVSSMVEAGHLFLPATAPWVDAYVNEMAAFPQGRFDDQVDASSQLLDWARSRLFTPKTELAGPIGVFEDRYGNRTWSGDVDGTLDTSRIAGWVD